jgi:hypothetical protein
VTAGAQPGHICLHCAGTENERWNIQGQHQQGQQHATAAHTQGQGRANGADQGQHRGTHQKADHQHAQGPGRKVELQAQHRCQQHQGQAGGQPVGQHLATHQQGQRSGRQAHLLESSVLVVGCEQAVEGQHGGQQGGDPQHARGNAPQHGGFRPDAQGKQADHDHEEEQGREHLALAPGGEEQVTTDDGNEGAHWTLSVLRTSGWCMGRLALMPAPLPYRGGPAVYLGSGRA